MSKKVEVGGDGNFGNFEDLFKTHTALSEQMPTGVSYNKQGKYLYSQFVHPGTTSRLPGTQDYGFSYEGLIKGKEDAFRIAQALETITSVTDFWEWSDREIGFIQGYAFAPTTPQTLRALATFELCPLMTFKAFTIVSPIESNELNKLAAL